MTLVLSVVLWLGALIFFVILASGGRRSDERPLPVRLLEPAPGEPAQEAVDAGERAPLSAVPSSRRALPS
jgi:hypothetical protein